MCFLIPFKSIPGVRHFFAAKDIPGLNRFTPPSIFTTEDEPIFVAENAEIQFYDQPVGIILADTMELANLAVGKVKIMYADHLPTGSSISYTELLSSMTRSFFGNVLFGSSNGGAAVETKHLIIPTLKEAYELNARDRFIDRIDEKAKVPRTTDAYGEPANTIKGSLIFGAQYHFSMETHSTVCMPDEQGINVLTSTNWMDFSQTAIAECLNIAEHRVNIEIRHLGGSYGCKISRGALIACACALGCHLTNRTVRFVMTIESNMSTIGKRYALHSEYEVQSDRYGRIEKLTNLYAHDFGCSLNEPVDYFVKSAIGNCYATDTWSYRSQAILTDAPSQTFARAPGTMEAIAMTETIIEHLAWSLGLDSWTVRLANIPADSMIRQMLPGFLEQTGYNQRKIDIDRFNGKNRWRKRGIALSPMKWPLTSIGGIPAYVAIYHRDGSVVISHGGTECGQGINTKAAQVAAFILGIPLDLVSVKASNNVIGANAITTGGSVTSDIVCLVIMQAIF